MTATAQLTSGEEAILRSWLGGHQVKDIAKARRDTAEHITEALIDLCDLNRDVGRRVLRDGTRRPNRRHPAKYDPAHDAEGARVQQVVNEVLLDHAPGVAMVLDAARALSAKAKQTGSAFFQTPWHETTQLQRALAALDGTPQPELAPQPVAPTQTADPLERWSAHRCADCRWIGPFIDHDEHTDCPGQLQPVALLVVPREQPCQP